MTMLDTRGGNDGSMSGMPSAPNSNNAQSSGASASQGVNKTVNLDDIDDDLPF